MNNKLRVAFSQSPFFEYKSFFVEKGKNYEVVIEYRRGNENFAMLRGDICERKLIDFSDLQVLNFTLK